MSDSRPPTVMCPRCGCQAHYIGDLDAYQCHGCYSWWEPPAEVAS